MTWKGKKIQQKCLRAKKYFKGFEKKKSNPIITKYIRYDEPEIPINSKAHFAI